MPTPIEVLPEAFIERLHRIIPTEHWPTVIASFAQPTPTTLRVNTLKASVAAVRDALERTGLKLEAVPWYPEAFILRSGALAELQETVCYQEGHIYVQGLSSMLPALVLGPQPGENVLDLAAAPGSKTTQIACLMQGQGTVVANDNNRVRFYKLRANVHLQGAACVRLSLRDGQWFEKARAAQFDRVLVDAPCSTEASFYIHKPSSYNYWRPGKIHEMAHKQRRLLLAGVRAAKPGARVVYSTCTFAPEENEAVVDWVLQREAVQLLPVKLPLPNLQAGLTNWEGDTYAAGLHLTQRVLPNQLLEGFYIACLQRVG